MEAGYGPLKTDPPSDEAVDDDVPTQPAVRGGGGDNSDSPPAFE